jgi:hypothetical protein
MSTPSEHDRPGRSDPTALAIETIVYAPIGAAAFVREMGPDVIRTVVARGRAEVDVVSEYVTGRVKHAKGAGEVAIAFGLPVLRKKVEERIASLRPTDTPPEPPRRRPQPSDTPTRIVVSIAPDASDSSDAAAPSGASNGHRTPVPVPDARADVDMAEDEGEGETLAIPGYDALSASQVVERLAGLSGDELAAVRRYEAGHRRRRTILGKIEQLTA